MAVVYNIYKSAQQVEHKQETFLQQLQHFAGVQPQELAPPLQAEPWGYRRKARLGVRYVTKKDAVLVGFREKNGRFIADIKECHILYPKVAQLLLPLRTLIANLTQFREIAQIEVAVGDDDQSVALIFRHLGRIA